MSGPRKAPVALAAAPADFGALLARRDRWRDRLNPLRGLSMQNAITWMDQYQAGVTANIEWIWQKIEAFDSDLVGLIESTNSALTQLNWHVKTADGDVRRAAQWDKVLAAEQQNALYEFYNGIDNMTATLEALAMMKYRGYAHVQIRAQNTWLTEWEPLDQWNVCRDGYKGDWFWNPEARQVFANALPPANILDPSCYLIVETPRPVDIIGILKYLRMSLSQKDWDAYIEIYGIPAWILEMPSNVPVGKEEEYAQKAADVAAGGSGAVPAGTKATAASYPSGKPPFRDYQDYWSERIVLAGTGGLLTSLSLPQGIGKGATDAHQETFGRIARARCRIISEQFQRKIDKQILKARFPGRPILAYFEWDASEVLDPGQIADHFVKIRQAGFQGDPQQFQDRTGYRVTLSTNPPPVPGEETIGLPALRSRADGQHGQHGDPAEGQAAMDAETTALAKSGAALYAAATQAGFRPLAEALWPLLDIEDPGALAAAMEAVLKRFPAMSKKIFANDANAKALADIKASAVANGMASVAARKGAR